MEDSLNNLIDDVQCASVIAIERKKAIKMARNTKTVAIIMMILSTVTFTSLFSIPIGVFIVVGAVKLIVVSNNLKQLCNGSETASAEASAKLAEAIKDVSIGFIICLIKTAILLMIGSAVVLGYAFTMGEIHF